MKPRLLFVCPTSSPIGGLQTWLDEIATGLNRFGWSVLVALVQGPTTHNPTTYRAAHPKLETLVIDGSGLSMAARVRAVSQVIRRTLPDLYLPLTVIDAHDAVCLLKRSQSFKGRYVLTLHGNLPQQISDAKRYQAFADASINPGRLTCNLAQWVGIPESRLFHVPHGAVIHPMRQVSAIPQSIRLAYVGRLTNEDKRVMDLVPLVNALTERNVRFELDIVGSGPCEAKLRAEIKHPNVRFHGFVDATRLHQDYFPHWDAVLLFSDSEAFGLSLMEAMSHGVLPLSSRFLGHRSEGFLVDGTNCRLFDIGDMVSAAKIIEELAEQREEIAKLARNAHDMVSQQYSWDHCIKGWHSALETTLSQPPRLPVPHDLPRALDEGNSLASKFPWLPKSLSDRYYQLKRQWRGIPEAFRHGEEWPIDTGLHSPEFCHSFRTIANQLDH